MHLEVDCCVPVSTVAAPCRIGKAFVPDLAHVSAGLRPLLKKGNAWVWEKEHEEEFNKIKNLLTSPTVAEPFDNTKDTILLTDASRLHGLGYAVVQRNRKGELSMI